MSLSNHLEGQTSPYLLQHKDNPVDWYPWGEEAFQRARDEDKPIFLSIGYSTCHWCHVMARESFESAEIADILNRYFIAVKVDKEERPDLDSIYMAVCQAFTGSGGWPTSIFMTPDGKPFFAGTYFPPSGRYGSIGLRELLSEIRKKWASGRESLLRSAKEVVDALKRFDAAQEAETESWQGADEGLIEEAVRLYKGSYDERFGGFGNAPKFPAAHNLIFLLTYYEKSGDERCLSIAENTLAKMHAGGLFDHVGYGFCRYSTDKYFLVPHFEKMLYDNALLILAYCKAFSVTGKPFYKEVAEKTARYILREMTSPQGGFFSAQDADSDGKEGRYYVFEPSEVISVLGRRDGEDFNRRYDITAGGNFEGKSIPNLRRGDAVEKDDILLRKLYEYRRKRFRLHLDDKIVTSWNSLMIAALCRLYRVSRKPEYLDAAKAAQSFIEREISEGDTLFVSFREGKRGARGFLDDYANYIFALLALYEATLDAEFLRRAKRFLRKATVDFYDAESGGFYLYGREHETLILRPKETYDGAVPSGNSVMAYALTRLFYLAPDDETERLLKRQLDFMSARARSYPAGHAVFLIALSDYFEPPQKIVAVVKESCDIAELPFAAPIDGTVIVLDSPTEEYPLKDGKTTYYICKEHSCMPPVNRLDEAE